MRDDYYGYSSGNCYQKVKDFMLAAPAGAVFAKVDFEGYGNDATVRKALSRMVEEGICKQVMPSVYYRSAGGEGGKDFVVPDAYEVALAKARTSGWNVVLAPVFAMHEFGLTDAVPEQLEVWSSGRSCLCSGPGCEISFRHADSHWLQCMSPDCFLTVSALLGLKEIRILPDDLEKIARQLRAEQKELLLKERMFAPAWMRPYLEMIGHDMNKGVVDALVGTRGGDLLFYSDAAAREELIRAKAEDRGSRGPELEIVFGEDALHLWLKRVLPTFHSEALANAVAKRLLAENFERFSRKQLEYVYLHYVKDMSTSEIGALYGVSRDAVASGLRSANAKIPPLVEQCACQLRWGTEKPLSERLLDAQKRAEKFKDEDKPRRECERLF